MNLQELLSVGVVVPRELAKQTVTWKHRDENKKPVETVFDVYVKRDMSAADFEYIFANREQDETFIARRVSRLVRLGANGSEIIPYESAAEMKPGLLIALANAINAVEKEDLPPETKEDKPKK